MRPWPNSARITRYDVAVRGSPKATKGSLPPGGGHSLSDRPSSFRSNSGSETSAASSRTELPGTDAKDIRGERDTRQTDLPWSNIAKTVSRTTPSEGCIEPEQ